MNPPGDEKNLNLLAEDLEDSYTSDLSFSIDQTDQAARLSGESCSPSSHVHRWKIPVEILNKHLSLTFKVNVPHGLVELETQDPRQNLHFQLTESYPNRDIFLSCKNQKNGTDIFINPDHALISYFKELLTKSVPDCDWSLRKGLWSCTLPDHVSSQEKAWIAQAHDQFRKNWGKVPYFLSRRINLTHQLSLLSDDPEGVDNFCRLVAFSLPEEKPLIFHSSLWKGALCSEKNRVKTKEILNFGLKKSLSEIQFLFQLSEKVSHTDQVRFDISAKPLEGQNIRLILMPMQDVRNHILSALKGPKQLGWSPFFDSPQESGLAKSMGVLDGPKTSFPGDKGELSVDYLVKSLMGETSFLVSPGDTKSLRLLEGHYKLMVRRESEDFRNENLCLKEEILGSLFWSKSERRKIARVTPILSEKY
jgi:hypothetical protein